MRSLSSSSSIALIGCAFAALGCNAPAVGEWRSAHKLGNGERNQLVVNSDQTGSAVVWATHPADANAWNKFRFDLAWEDFTEEFRFDMACRECAPESFKMRCIVVAPTDGTADKMDCKGDGSWTGYAFDWERVE